MATVQIAGEPAITLRVANHDFEGPGFLEATVLPGRGMMLLQARLRLPDGRVVDAIAAPDLLTAAALLNGGPEDFSGNASFSFGGAILAPFANRIRGSALPSTREIETSIAGWPTRLPRNWGGKAAGSEAYAMHGLILATPFSHRLVTPAQLTGRLLAGSFGDRWPGSMRLDIAWSLEAGALQLRVTATNTGNVPSPVGIGWHPYFNIPSQERARARLFIPAPARVEVCNYDEVLPTGQLRSVTGGDYDFMQPEGRALGSLYLDDCFTRFDRSKSNVMAELHDPAEGLGLRIRSPSPAVQALQVYAPPEHSYVVLEPQFNLANPFGAEWRGHDTGMTMLQPGKAESYDVSVAAFSLPCPQASGR